MDKVLAAVGAASLTSFGAFWRWHTPKVEPLSKGFLMTAWARAARRD